MTRIRKVTNFLLGSFMVMMGLALFFQPEDGVEAIMGILSIVLIIIGIRLLIQYFTMAKHMVGGKSTLYLGLIVLDFGMVSASMMNESRFYIMMYLIGAHAFAGVIGLLKSLEERRYGVNSWKFKMLYALGNLVVVLACLFFIRTTTTLVQIYGIGLSLTGLAQIATIFRKIDVVYVQ